MGGSAASRCAAGGVLSSCDTPDTPLLCLAALVKSCASTRAVFDAGAAPREPPPSGRFNGTTSTLDPVEDGARGRGADDGARLRGTVACAGVSGGGARTGGAESGTGGGGPARIGEAESGAERRKSAAGVLPAMDGPNAAFATLKFATLASGQGVSMSITPGSGCCSEIVVSTASLNAVKASSGSGR